MPTRTKTLKPKRPKPTKRVRYPEPANQRLSSTKRGYGYRWQKIRIAFLQQNPLCVMCQKEEVIKPATVVDHIQPHKGDQALFWDQNNWQPLCNPHHRSVSAKYDGAFGNPVKTEEKLKNQP